MIHVLAEIALAPGARDAFVAEFRRLTPLVRAEDGCIEYDGVLEVATTHPAQLPVRADVLTVVEKWRDEAALHAHAAAPHMADHRERSAGLATGVTIRVYESI
jgi:quinol monooxygenase YgiN